MKISDLWPSTIATLIMLTCWVIGPPTSQAWPWWIPLLPFWAPVVIAIVVTAIEYLLAPICKQQEDYRDEG